MIKRLLALGLAAVLLLGACKKERRRRDRDDDDDHDRRRSRSGAADICDAFRKLAKKAGEKDRDKDYEECRTELGEIEKNSPEAFRCIERCMDKHDEFETARKCIGECMSDPEVREQQKKRAEERMAGRETDREKQILGWIDAPEKEFETSIEGYGEDKATPFSIVLVEPFKPDEPSSDTLRRFVLQEEGALRGVAVTIMPDFEPKLADDIEGAKRSAQKVVRQIERGRGYLLSTQSDDTLDVVVVTFLGEQAVKCSAHMFTGSDLSEPTRAKLVSWFEKLCSSVRG